MMMIMNYFLGTPLSTAWEGKLRKKLKLHRYDLIPAINLAYYMAQQGLEVNVRHQDSHKFWSRIRLFNEDIYLQLQAAHSRERKYNTKFGFGPISKKDIIDELRNGRLLIYGTFLSENIKHALLVYKHEGDLFYLIDPLIGRKTCTEDELIKVGDLDTGRWYIAVGT